MKQEVQIYQNKNGIAKTFGISRQTVYNVLPGIEEQVRKGRYTKYAVLDGQIHIGVFADYLKYRKMLENEKAKRYVPPFDLSEALTLFQE